MLIITQQLINSNPETFSGDVTDCNNFYVFFISSSLTIAHKKQEANCFLNAFLITVFSRIIIHDTENVKVQKINFCFTVLKKLQ